MRNPRADDTAPPTSRLDLGTTLRADPPPSDLDEKALDEDAEFVLQRLVTVLSRDQGWGVIVCHPSRLDSLLGPIWRSSLPFALPCPHLIPVAISPQLDFECRGLLSCDVVAAVFIRNIGGRSSNAFAVVP